MDFIVRVRVEGRVERAVHIQSRDTVARHTQNTGERAADKNLPVRLNGGGIDLAPDAADDTGIECLVEPAIGLQSADAIARHRRAAVWRKCSEKATHQNLAVRLRSEEQPSELQ